MWTSVRAFPGALLSVVVWIAGVAGATLPKRWWPMLDAYIPVTDYLEISGTWRGIAAAVDDPFGDPILTGVDALVGGGMRRIRSDVARNAIREH
jgi:hypothetical protein